MAWRLETQISRETRKGQLGLLITIVLCSQRLCVQSLHVEKDPKNGPVDAQYGREASVRSWWIPGLPGNSTLKLFPLPTQSIVREGQAEGVDAPQGNSLTHLETFSGSLLSFKGQTDHY